MANYTYEELLELIVADIPITNEKNCYAIAFIAFPGSGKSTVAKKISEKTGLYITANDKIRRTLEGLGYDVENTDRKLVESLSNDRTKYMLENKTSMIIDANMQFFYQMAIDNFQNYNAKLYFVKLECSEDEILKRIDARALNLGKDSGELSRAGRETYYAQREKSLNNVFPQNIIFHTIDTEKELDSQVEELLDKINKELQ